MEVTVPRQMTFQLAYMVIQGVTGHGEKEDKDSDTMRDTGYCFPG